MTHGSETVGGTLGGAALAAGGKLTTILSIGAMNTQEIIYSAAVSGIVGATVGFFVTLILKRLWAELTGKKEKQA